jgi:hypothetical protein
MRFHRITNQSSRPNRYAFWRLISIVKLKIIKYGDKKGTGYFLKKQKIDSVQPSHREGQGIAVGLFSFFIFPAPHAYRWGGTIGNKKI